VRRVELAAGLVVAALLFGACQADKPVAAPSVVSVPPASASAASTPPLAAPSSSSASEPASVEGHGDGSCTGQPPADLSAVVSQRAMQLHRCYNAELVKLPTAQGAMHVGFRLETDGRVSGVHVLSSDLPPEMGDCIVEQLRSATYPPPIGGCLDVTLPLVFKSIQSDAGAPP